jgi:hypothetical protein
MGEWSVSAMAYCKRLPNALVISVESQNIFGKEECFKILSKDFQKFIKTKKQKLTHSLPILLLDGSSLLLDSLNPIKGQDVATVYTNAILFSHRCHSNAKKL